jgi:hypothetical protein
VPATAVDLPAQPHSGEEAVGLVRHLPRDVVAEAVLGRARQHRRAGGEDDD